jgi:hypothetical protein
MRCRDFERLLDQARDDGRDAPAGEAARDAASADLVAHAAGCAPCARLHRAEHELRASLLRLRATVPAAPTGFAVGVHRRIALRRAERPSIFGLPLAATVAVATAGAILVAALLLSPAGQPGVGPIVPARASHAGSALDAAPVVWSDGGVEIVAPASGEPEPAQESRQAVAVLVEWNL